MLGESLFVNIFTAAVCAYTFFLFVLALCDTKRKALYDRSKYPLLITRLLAMLLKVITNLAGIISTSHPSTCYIGYKVAHGLYVLSKLFLYLFLYFRAQTVAAKLRIKTRCVKGIGLVVWGMLPFSGFIAAFSYGNLRPDGWCQSHISASLTAIMAVADFGLSLGLLWLFVHPLLGTHSILQSFATRSIKLTAICVASSSFVLCYMTLLHMIAHDDAFEFRGAQVVGSLLCRLDQAISCTVLLLFVQKKKKKRVNPNQNGEPPPTLLAQESEGLEFDGQKMSQISSNPAFTTTTLVSTTRTLPNVQEEEPSAAPFFSRGTGAMQEEHKEGSFVPTWAKQRALLREKLLGGESGGGSEPDGRWSSLIEDVVVLVEAFLGKELDGSSMELKGHTDSVLAVCTLSDDRLASGSRDRTVRIWSQSSGACLQTLQGHTGIVYALCALSDDRLASGSRDRTVRIWSQSGGACLQTLQGHTDDVNALCALSDDRLVSCSRDKTLRIWSQSSGACLQTLQGHTASVYALCALSDDRLASGSFDRTVRIWSQSSGTCLQTLSGCSGHVFALCALSDDRLASGLSDGTVRIWSLLTGESQSHTGWVNVCALSDATGSDALASDDKNVRIWSPQSSACLQTPQRHTGWVNALCALSGDRLASGSDDKTVHIWSLSAGACLGTLRGHTGSVYALCALSDDRLASGSGDAVVRIWC